MTVEVPASLIAAALAPAESLFLAGMGQVVLGAPSGKTFVGAWPAAASPCMLSRVASESWWSRLVGRAWFWTAVVATVAALPLARAFSRRMPPLLPTLGVIEDFSLIDPSGAPFGSRELRGRTWIAAALSPSGADGDLIGDELATIQHRAHNLGADFQVISISSDPAHDAPPELAAFVQSHRGSPRMWRFLTGDEREVARLLQSFSALAGGSRAWLVLVDGQLRVRAVYAPHDPGVVERVLFDVGLLVNRGG
jgi:protein SCO1/2